MKDLFSKDRYITHRTCKSRYRENSTCNIIQRTELAESCQEFGWISFCSFHHINQPGSKLLGSSIYSKECLGAIMALRDSNEIIADREKNSVFFVL